MTQVLLVGFTADGADPPPGVSVDELGALIARGDTEVADAGYDTTRGWIDRDIERSLQAIRESLELGDFDIVMIGNGVRSVPQHTELFERLVNLVHEVSPRAGFAFNDDPPSTVNALRRNK